MLTVMPTYDELLHPLLVILAEQSEPLRARDIRAQVINHLELSPELRAESLPNSRQLRIENRMGWAHDRLKRMGWSSCPVRGKWQITEAGRAFLAEHPEGLSVEERNQIINVRYEGDAQVIHPSRVLDPDEQIEASLKEIRDSLAEDLLDQILGREPEFFERLVIDLLKKMGYGVGDEVHTPLARDEGIDGIISMDVLGLQKVYLQAKRYARDNAIGRPALQAFVGAVSVCDTQMGIFITTSRFTKEAKAYATRLTQPLVLIDGARLTSLMIDYKLGVSAVRVIELPQLDRDYFNED